MALFPDVQRKIQEEIDSIVGNSRLPSVRDRPSMPYVEATMKETLRWKPALPLSIARKSNQADYYKGQLFGQLVSVSYRIKDTTFPRVQL